MSIVLPAAIVAGLAVGAQVAPTISAIAGFVNVGDFIVVHWSTTIPKLRLPSLPAIGKPGVCYRAGISKVECK